VSRDRRIAALGVALFVAVSVLACGSSGSGAPVATIANRAFDSARSPMAPAVLWAVGDGADGSAVARTLADRIRRSKPDRFLYLGDVYEHGTARDFREHYATVYGELARITTPTPGNHEWTARRDGYQPYWRAQTGATPPPWYSYKIGGWRVISLNSEAPHDEGSPQLVLGARQSLEYRFCSTPAVATARQPGYGTEGQRFEIVSGTL
jgi:hypothetical protein